MQELQLTLVTILDISQVTTLDTMQELQHILVLTLGILQVTTLDTIRGQETMLVTMPTPSAAHIPATSLVQQ